MAKRKREVDFAYDVDITNKLEWPSITVQWLPGQEKPAGKDFSVQRLILGTHAPGDEYHDYLMLAQVQLQNKNDDDVRGGFHAAHAKVEIVQQILHDGEVNRARYMPQNPFLIATKTVSGEVYLFDYRKHPSKPPLDGACNPYLRLRGHSSEGNGLSWNQFKQGHLLSGSDDSRICLWDINASPQNKALDAIQTFKIHQGVVEDVAWHQRHEFIFGSVGEDKYLYLWDLRTPSVNKPSHSLVAHQSLIHSLAFNPFNEWVVATGSSDKTAKLFDFRMLSTAIHTFDFHKDEVYQVGWSPTNKSVLASSYLGRELMVWDLNRIDEKQTAEEAELGPPELLFIHSGHTSKISDFSWNPCEPGMIASVGEDHLLQIWQMAKNIYHIEDDMRNASTGNTNCVTISD